MADVAEQKLDVNANANEQVESSLDTPKQVNGLGLSCPEPLMLLRKCLRESESGQLIELLSDDPVSLRDVPALCEFMNHTLLSLPDEAHPHRFLVRKG